jgi:TatD DNase family protein
MITVGTVVADSRAAIAVARAHDDVWATAGVHPHDAKDGIDGLAELLGEPEVVAVGECGLDYHYDHSPRDLQRRAFASQLALAREFGRPVVVHTREAEADTQAMVVEAGRAGVVGVLHCYTGGHDLALAALEVGWYVSFSGIVTFKKWTDDALVRLVPDDRLLVESDSPYLAPVPHRGKRNEPAWVSFTVARVAAARAAQPADVGSLVARNAIRFFNLPLHSESMT